MNALTNPRDDRKSYSVRFHHRNLPGNSRQTQIAVYTFSQKRAAELMGVPVKELQTYGGSGGSIVGPLLRENPDVAFVALDQHGRQWITLETLELGVWGEGDIYDVSDNADAHFDEMMGRKQTSPAFGMISINRIQGARNLFMVDYPIDHFIRITFRKAELRNRSGHDSVFGDDEVASVDLSEIQFARLIASPNTMGTPCTFHHFVDPETGDRMTPQIPDRHVADGETFRQAVEEKAAAAMQGVADAQAILDEAMKGGSIRKGDIQKALDALARARREGVANLGYVVQTAHEAIDTASQHAQAEVDAHIDFAMTRLGKEALGDRIYAAIESGVDFKDVGAQVLTAITPPATDVADDDERSPT